MIGPRDPFNWQETGGALKWRRRLPGFTIHRHTSGRFYITDERPRGQPGTVASGYASPEDAEKANAWRIPAWG